MVTLNETKFGYIWKPKLSMTPTLEMNEKLKLHLSIFAMSDCYARFNCSVMFEQTNE